MNKCEDIVRNIHIERLITYSNPYVTPTSFDSDITNTAFYNFNQPSMPDWSYPNQLMAYFKYYEKDWNNHHLHSLKSQWEYNSRELYYQQSYQYSTSYTPFLEQQKEEPIDWEKWMEALQELERRIQNIEDSKSH